MRLVDLRSVPHTAHTRVQCNYNGLCTYIRMYSMDLYSSGHLSSTVVEHLAYMGEE